MMTSYIVLGAIYEPMPLRTRVAFGDRYPKDSLQPLHSHGRALDKLLARALLQMKSGLYCVLRIQGTHPD
jgi:hypothetical protein